MNILYVINSLRIGGAEKIVSDIVLQFKKKGYNIGVLIFDGYDTILKETLIDNKIDVYCISTKSIYNPFVIFKIVPIIKRYDIIHSHLFPSQYWVALASCFCPSIIKIITTEHSTSNKRRNHLLTRITDTIIYKMYDKIITISDKALLLFNESYGSLKGKSVCIYNGVDISKFKSSYPNSDIRKTGNDVFVTMVASFRYPKDQDTIIKALQFLPDNYKALFVGDGPRIELCKQLAIDLGVDSRTIFMGVRNDVPSILHSSDIIVLSSKYEGLSLSSLEGMCVGKPFIASNVDGLEEVVSDAGLLFEYGDYNTLAKILLSLMTDSNLYNRVAKQCLLRAEQYDIGETVRRYELLYNELM